MCRCLSVDKVGEMEPPNALTLDRAHRAGLHPSQDRRARSSSPPHSFSQRHVPIRVHIQRIHFGHSAMCFGVNCTGSQSARRYSGCLGAPSFVTPRQDSRFAPGIAATSRTRSGRALAPHAAITRPGRLRATRTAVSFSGPTGSSTVHSSCGLVARYAYRFTTWMPSYPSVRANPQQRRIVGSSCDASAVDGFSITKVSQRPSPQTRRRVYRYFPSCDTDAALRTGGEKSPGSVGLTARSMLTTSRPARQNDDEATTRAAVLGMPPGSDQDWCAPTLRCDGHRTP